MLYKTYFIPTNAAVVIGGDTAGGDLVYAKNLTGQTLQAGDKVLLRKPVSEATVNTELQIPRVSTANAAPNLPIFVSDDAVIFNNYNQFYVYKKVGGVWSFVQSSSSTTYISQYNYIPHFNKQLNRWYYTTTMTVASKYSFVYFFPPETAGLEFYTSYPPMYYDAEAGMYLKYSQMYGYTGRIYKNSDISADRGEYVKDDGNYNSGGNGVGLGDVGYWFCGAPTNIVLMKTDITAGTIEQLASVNTGGTNAMVGFTGIETGDYVLVNVDPNDNYHGAYNVSNAQRASVSTSRMALYRLDREAGTFTPVTDSAHPLARYFTEPCMFNFNDYNKVLVVGTATDIKLFYFDTVGKEFVPMAVDLPQLPEKDVNIDDFFYWGAISPDMKTLMIGTRLWNNANNANAIIYDLGADATHWEAYDNTVANFGEDAFQGVATGNVDENGFFEIQTVLPDVVTYSLVISPAPDKFEFLGGAL